MIEMFLSSPVGGRDINFIEQTWGKNYGGALTLFNLFRGHSKRSSQIIVLHWIE